MPHKLLLVAAVAAMLICGWTDVMAAQFVALVSCDSVSVQGVPCSRIQLEMRSPADGTWPYIGVYPIASPVTGDTCRIVSAVAPPGWSVTVGTNGLWAQWQGDVHTALWPGQALGGFQLIVTRKHPCCFETWFANAFDSWSEKDCFDDGSPIPVPTLRRTWGELKSLYR